VLAGEFNASAHQVGEGGGPGWDQEANGAGLAGGFQARDLIGRKPVTGAVVDPGRPGGLGRFAFGGEVLGPAVAVVRGAGSDEAIGSRAILVQTLGLKVRRVRT
jgi:hypothetical protein